MANLVVKNKGTKKISFGAIFKGVLIGLCVSLLLTLGVALISAFLEIGDEIISIISMVIRQASVVVAAFFAVKEKQLGWLVGIITGLIFTVCAFIIFSIIEGQFVIDQKLGLDFLFAVIFGAISGIIAVNLKK